MSNLMKIRTVGAKLFHAERWKDEQTDRHDESNSCFSVRHFYCANTSFVRQITETTQEIGENSSNNKPQTTTRSAGVMKVTSGNTVLRKLYC